MNIRNSKGRIHGNQLTENYDLEMTLKVLGDPEIASIYTYGRSLRMTFPRKLAVALDIEPNLDGNV